MLYSELPIYKTVYPLSVDMFIMVKHMNRVDRILLGEPMFSTVLNMLKSILKANTLVNEHDRRLGALHELRFYYEHLKTLIRVCEETKIISYKRAANLAITMDSIGKQINSWIRGTEKRANKAQETIEEIQIEDNNLDVILGGYDGIVNENIRPVSTTEISEEEKHFLKEKSKFEAKKFGKI